MSRLPKGHHALTQLFAAGTHIGHRTRYWVPQMAPALYASRQGTHLLDLKVSATALSRALSLVAQVLREGGRLLIVGNRSENALLVQTLGHRYPDRVQCVTRNWIGGALSNQEAPLSTRRRKGKAPFPLFPGSLSSPDLVLLLNLEGNEALVREAARLPLPVIGLVDTNLSPRALTYPLPGNDDLTSTHFLYTQALAYVLHQALTNASSP